MAGLAPRPRASGLELSRYQTQGHDNQKLLAGRVALEVTRLGGVPRHRDLSLTREFPPLQKFLFYRIPVVHRPGCHIASSVNCNKWQVDSDT